jgi:hypothetical protein
VELAEVYKVEILVVFQDQAATHLVARKQIHLVTAVVPVAVPVVQDVPY